MNLKKEIKPLFALGARAVQEALYRARLRKPSGLYYLSESSDWIIRWIGESLLEHLPNENVRGLKTSVQDNPYFLTKSLIHFGSINSFHQYSGVVHPSNRTVATIWHGKPGQEEKLTEALNYFKSHERSLDLVLVSNSLMEARLLNWGVRQEKLKILPLGVDLNSFQKGTPAEKQRLREEYRIPETAFCVGSFQKDGVGWGEGDEPKLIKGPDLFLEAMGILKKEIPELFVVLTGPSRGYVKKGLRRLGIPFIHHYVKNPREVSEFYKVLDVYLISSREEGGPSALLESMASGVPVVATKTGMCPDLIENSKTGILISTFEASEMAEKILELSRSREWREKLSDEGLRKIQNFSWEKISKCAFQEIYEPLLKDLKLLTGGE